MSRAAIFDDGSTRLVPGDGLADRSGDGEFVSSGPIVDVGMATSFAVSCREWQRRHRRASL